MLDNLIDLYIIVLYTMLGGALALIPVYAIRLTLKDEENPLERKESGAR